MMQFIKTLLRRDIILGIASSRLLPILLGLLSAALIPRTGIAQSTNLPQGSPYDHFLDRLQIMQQSNPSLNFSSDKPISRKIAVRIAEMTDSLHTAHPDDSRYRLSATDLAMLYSLRLNNIEWTSGSQDNFASKTPWLKTFYTEKANFYKVTDKDFFLAVDPAIQETQSVESGNSERVFLNSKGITLRGTIADKLGFSAYITDNQERGPTWFQQRA